MKLFRTIFSERTFFVYVIKLVFNSPDAIESKELYLSQLKQQFRNIQHTLTLNYFMKFCVFKICESESKNQKIAHS